MGSSAELFFILSHTVYIRSIKYFNEQFNADNTQYLLIIIIKINHSLSMAWSKPSFVRSFAYIYSLPLKVNNTYISSKWLIGGYLYSIHHPLLTHRLFTCRIHIKSDSLPSLAYTKQREHTTTPHDSL